MASPSHPSLASPDKPRHANDEVWEEYLHDAEEEGKHLGQYSTTTMNGMLTFAGLFAATIAAFLVESYKSLSPDTGTQTVALLSQLTSPSRTASTTHTVLTNVPAFQPSHSAIIVNTLWFFGLVISLVAALLATLIQEWTRQFMWTQSRRWNLTIEQHSLECLSKHMGMHRYGLHHIAALTIGLMHVAVILFLAGVDVFLFSVNRAVAIAVTSLTAVAAVAYIVPSCIPLWDYACPYRTPMTDFIVTIFVIPVSTISCVVTYLALLCVAAVAWTTKRGPTDPAWREIITPRAFVSCMEDPRRNVRIIGTLVQHGFQYVFRTAGGGAALPDKIERAMDTTSPPPLRGRLGDNELSFLFDRIGPTIFDRPSFLQYLAAYVINPESKSFGHTFVGFRWEVDAVRKLAATLKSVHSVEDAIGTLRLLQMLLQSRSKLDDEEQVMSRENARWENLDDVVDGFAEFYDELGLLNERAIHEGDIRVLAAFCSLYWSLLLLWKRIPGSARSNSRARTQMRRLFRDIHGSDNSLRPLHLSSSDSDATDRVFTTSDNPCRELAARNAFTLLTGAHRCTWSGDWHDPDSPYLASIASTGLWSWDKVFADTSNARQRHIPQASGELRSFLLALDPRMQEWMLPGSDHSFPHNMDIHPVAARALRDIVQVVDLSTPSGQAVNGDIANRYQSSQDSGMDIAPSTSALDRAERGMAGRSGSMPELRRNAVELTILGSQSQDFLLG